MNKNNNDDYRLIFRSTIKASEGESRTIEGVACVFNSWSQDLGGFIERILPDAITNDLLGRSDVIANYEHNSPDYMMARYKMGDGTLSLDLRDDGLYFSFDAPETAKGDELLWHVRNGNITECSFAFAIASDGTGEKWYRDPNNQLCRDITRIEELYDISLVQNAAYPATYCHTRSLQEFKAKETQAKLDGYDAELQEIENFCI